MADWRHHSGVAMVAMLVLCAGVPAAARVSQDVATEVSVTPDAAEPLVAEGRFDEAADIWLDEARGHVAANDRVAAVAVLEAGERALTDAGADEHPALGRVFAMLGGLNVAQGRYDAGLALLARAEVLHGDGMTPIERASLFYDRAHALMYLNRAEEAEAVAGGALDLRREQLGDDHPLVAQSLNQMGVVFYYQARFDEAERIYRDAVAVSEAAYGPVDRNVSLTLANLGNVMQRLGREHYAEPIYRRAVRIAEVVNDDGLLATSLVNLGWQLRLVGRSEEADPIFRRSVELMIRNWGAEHWFTGIAVADVALVLGDQGLHAEAEPMFVQALGVLEPALGANNPELMITLDGYARSLAGMGRHDEAEALYERALGIARGHLVPGHPEATRQTVSAAGFLMDQGRAEEARTALAEARSAVFDRIAAGAERRTVALRSAQSLFGAQVRAHWSLAHAED